MEKKNTDNPYYDYVTETLIYYTGMGLKGDQSLNAAQNDRLNNSNDEEKNLGEKYKKLGLYFFIASRMFPRGNYKYLGRVQLIGTPRQSIQPGSDGIERKVWMFPLKFILAGEELKKLTNELSYLDKILSLVNLRRFPKFCD